MIFGKLISGSEESEQTRQIAAIRKQVFCEELKIPVNEETDAFAMYALAYEGETAVGTGAMTFDGEQYEIRDVAVLPEYRRKQYGDFLVRLLIDKAIMSGAQQIAAEVLTDAVPLFTKIGFETSGESYERSGKNWQPMQLKAGNLHKCCGCGK